MLLNYLSQAGYNSVNMMEISFNPPMSKQQRTPPLTAQSKLYLTLKISTIEGINHYSE